jgi:hypothetical protein
LHQSNVEQASGFDRNSRPSYGRKEKAQERKHDTVSKQNLVRACPSAFFEEEMKIFCLSFPHAASLFFAGLAYSFQDWIC